MLISLISRQHLALLTVYSFLYYPLTLAPMMQYSCTMPELKYLSESNISRNLRRKEMKHITSKPDDCCIDYPPKSLLLSLVVTGHNMTSSLHFSASLAARCGHLLKFPPKLGKKHYNGPMKLPTYPALCSYLFRGGKSNMAKI